jgi:hypothetical protein
MGRLMSTPHLDRTQVFIPAKADRLDVLRLVVRNACARRGASVDEIDDAALAVHEAGLALIDGGADRLQLDFGGNGDVLTIAIGSSNRVTLEPDDSMSFRIIEAVAAGFEISEGDAGTSIAIRLQVGTPGSDPARSE